MKIYYDIDDLKDYLKFINPFSKDSLMADIIQDDFDGSIFGKLLILVNIGIFGTLIFFTMLPFFLLIFVKVKKE